MFAGLRHLENFKGEMQEQSHLQWVMSNLRVAPSLKKVLLTEILPSWSLVLRGFRFCNMKELSLSLNFDEFLEDADPLCSGVEGAEQLTQLNLMLFTSRAGIVSILGTLQRKKQVTKFVGTFRYPEREASEEFDRVGAQVEAFFSSSHHLECIGFDFDCYYSGRRYPYFSTDKGMMCYVVRGLRHNQGLKTLRYRESLDKEIVDVLQEHNVTLQRIEGLRCYSSEHEEKIQRLLVANRYAKSFVANPLSVPVEHWGDVVTRIGTAERNCCVRGLAERALSSGTGLCPLNDH
jgi:hypothetical protein